MTWAAAGERAAGAVRWVLGHLELVLLVALVVAVALVIGQCNRTGRAEDAGARAAEAAELRAAGIAVAAELDRKALAGRLEAAQRWAVDLEAEVRRVRAVAPGARPVVVVTGTTGPVQAGGGAAAPVPAPGGGLSAAPSGGAPPPGRVCLLEQGDQGEIRVAGAALRGDAGALAVVGTAEAWRLGPDQRLFGGPLRLEVAGEPPARLPGWSYGLGAGASGQGALGALLVQTPPVEIPLFHWPARAWFLAAGGSREGLGLAGFTVEP